MKKLTKLVSVAALSLGILAACGDQEVEPAKSAEGKTVVKYSFPDGSVSLPELAEDLGYFEHIELERAATTGNGPEQIQLVATEQIDYAYAFSGAVVKAVSEGVDLKGVVSAYGVNEQLTSGLFVLEDSPIQTAKDLIGKKIGINVLGAQAEIITKQYLRDSGLTEEEVKQVQLVVIPYTSAEQTLRSKQVDAIRIGDLVKEKALENGGVREVSSDFKTYGNFNAGSYSFSDEYIEKNPEVVKDFVDGVAKANEWTRSTPKEEVIERFEKIIKERNPNDTTDNVQFWKTTGIETPGASFTELDWKLWVDYLEAEELIEKGKLSLEDLYTNEFNSFTK